MHSLEIHLHAIFSESRDQRRQVSAVLPPKVHRYGYLKKSELWSHAGQRQSFRKLAFEEGVVGLTLDRRKRQLLLALRV